MPAQGLEPQETLIVYVLDEEADLVQVRGYHHPRVATPPLRADDAAQRVGANLVGQSLKFLAGDLTLPLLPARHAGRLDQPLQQLLV